VKAQKCSLQDMRKIHKILAEQDKLKGQYEALSRCGAKKTFADWELQAEVVQQVGEADIQQLQHVQPSHLTVIGRGVTRSRWTEWVKRCEREKWTVPQLRKEIKLSKKPTNPLPKKAEGIHLADFRELATIITDNSVDLIFTDPPYDKSSLPLYKDLAEIAARVLKPGGSLLTYAGHYLVPNIFKAMSPPLRYWWMCGVEHTGTLARMKEYGIIVNWKPILWFVRDTRHHTEDFVNDWVIGAGSEKELHPWQQAENEAAYFIKALTKKNGIVFDPFCGSGTTAAAAKHLERRYITCDIDADAVETAKKRLNV
jgi:16S rRNA G966 N2-methylase RsmD